MSRAKDLRDLAALTEAVWLASSQSLRDAALRERQLNEMLLTLAAQRLEVTKELSRQQHGDGGLHSYSRWLRWTDAERVKLNRELLKARLALEHEQSLARRAFGRNQAAISIARRRQK